MGQTVVCTMTDSAKKADVVLLAGPTEDGKGANVVRVRPGQLETGEVRPLEDGKPITGEVVRLSPREQTPAVCDVEVLHSPPRHASSKPPQVANRAYRENWDAIFGAEAPTSSEPGRNMVN